MCIFVIWSAVMVVAACYESDYNRNVFGNFLDASWRLPEPQGEPKSACERDIQDMYTNLRNMTLWAYEMWDASARAPTGLLQGSQGHFGNWDQCVGERRPADGSLGMPRQYCLAYTYLQPFPHMEYPDDFHPHESAYNKLYVPEHGKSMNGSLAYWGICVPASCNHSQLSTILQDHFHNESLRIHASSRQLETVPGSNNTVRHEIQAKISSHFACNKPEEFAALFFGPGTIVFIVICGVAFVSVFTATWYHWYMNRLTNGGYECSGIVKALSLIINMRKLCYEGGSEDLPVLNGLRVISILQIIIVHRLMLAAQLPYYNWDFFVQFTNNFEWVFLSYADLVVDNFFLISGILISYRLLKWKPGSPVNFQLLIFGRFIRLIPIYIMVILYIGTVLPLLGSGPLWMALVGREAYYCKINWWTNLLMINNYVNTQEMCISASWFMPCEFHYFLLSLSILWLLRSKKRVSTGLIYLSSLFVISMIVPAFVTFYMKLPAEPPLNKNMREDIHGGQSVIQNIYIKTHTRASSYLIGLFTGYLLVKYQKSASKALSMKTSVLLSLTAIIVLFGQISTRYFTHALTAENHPVATVIYTALHRPVWAVAICTLLLCCILGDIAPVTAFLSWSPWAPLARLVYGVYLIHSAVQLQSFGITRGPYYYNTIKMFGEIAGDVFYSFFASFVLFLFIESPCRGIVHTLMAASYKKKSKDGEVGNKHKQYTDVEGTTTPLVKFV